MKKKVSYVIPLLFIMVLLLSFPASARWVKSGNTMVWYSITNVKRQSTWFKDADAGFVVIGNYTYCYHRNSKLHKGFFRTGNRIYYFNSKGQMIKYRRIRVGTKYYRAYANGMLRVNNISAVGKDYYCFDKTGARVYGKQTRGSRTCYFDPETGKMVKSKWIRIDNKMYYFSAKGDMFKNRWVGKFYFYKDGSAARNAWVGKRYVGSAYKYLTGLQKVGGALYYFDPDTGNKIVSTTKKISGKTYVFDADGKGKVKAAASVTVEDSYYTDPEVSDEDLLAAIINAEAGNQCYAGQVAVGIIITNRVKSSQFPNTIREVIYAKQQFEPARNGALTKYLKQPSLIPELTRKAAKLALNWSKTGKYTVIYQKKSINLKDYYFFMTPAAYARLGLRSETTTIQGHVFFKLWIR